MVSFKAFYSISLYNKVKQKLNKENTMWIDSHCHLQHCFRDKNKILEEINNIADELLYFVDVSTNTVEFLNISKLNLPSNLLLALGLYPEVASSYTERDIKNLKNFIMEGKVKAIGEIGLDFYHNYGSLIQQERLFREQLEIAIEFNLPIIVHSRNAFKDTYRILSSYKFNNPLILHCFSYSEEEARAFIEKGFYFSFSGNITYPNAIGIQKAALSIPAERILFETDSPYLTPVPKRGQKNNPLNVKWVYKFFSELKEEKLEDLQEQVTKNFKRIFFK